MRFPANCIIVATAAVLVGYRLAWCRNRSDRLHVFWRDKSGRAFEFYRKGASRRSYLQNAIYIGEIRRAPALDA